MRYKIPGLKKHYPLQPEKDVIVKNGCAIKYDQSWPLLLEGWAREGLTDKQMYENLKISYETFYLRLRQYPELLRALRKGRQPVNIIAENAIIKRFTGYDYEEQTQEAELSKVIDENGEELNEFKVVKRKVIKKHIVPDWKAAAYWLERRDKTKPWNLPDNDSNNGFVDNDIEIIVQDT